MENPLLERIDERIKALGTNDEAASKKAGLHKDTIRDIRRGKRGTLLAANLAKLARALETSSDWLLRRTDDDSPALHEEIPEFETPEDANGIRFGGVAEAGTFRRVNLYNQDAEYRLIPLSPNPNYPRDKQFAYRVEGDSMNLEHIMPGMWVHALDVHMWERLHGAPRDGELVIVEAKRNGDEERELTVKMLRTFRDRIELHPRSTNPDHQIYVIPYSAPNDYEDQVRVIAVVLSSTWLHRFKGP